MKKRNILHSPHLSELKRKRRNALLTRVILFVLIIGGSFTLISYAARASFLNVQTVAVSGNTIADSSLIERVVREEMQGKFIWLFPKSNIFFYPKKQITEALGKEFRRLTDISIELERTTLNISVAERISVYTWCGLMPQGSNEKCYFTDKNGFIFEEAPFFSEEVYFRFYGGDFKTAEEGLGNYFSKDNFPKFIKFKEGLEDIGLKPVALYQEDTDNAKIILSSKNIRKDNPVINFETDSNYDEVIENLDTALETEPLKSEIKNKYATLEYIDLRFGSKVYYRFR